MKYNSNKINKYKNAVLCFICSCITTVAFYMNSGTSILPKSVKKASLYRFSFYKLIEHIIYSVNSLNTFSLLLFAIVFYFFYKRKKFNGSKVNKVLAYLFSCLIPFMLLLCESYNNTNSWDLVFGSKSAVIVALIKIIGFSFPIYCVFSLLSNINFSSTYSKLSNKKVNMPFEILRYMVIILVCWIPYMFLLWPGCFSRDSQDEIAQALNNSAYCWTKDTIVLLDESVILNNHHPVFYTEILKVFLKLGKAISSYAISFEILCILQSFLLAFALSYAIAVMKKQNCKKSFLVAAIAFFALNPLFAIYAMTIVKDSIFCVLFVLTIVQLYEAITIQKLSFKRLFAFVVTLILFMLIRNNSFYIMALVFILVIIVLFKNKKRMLKVATSILIALLVFQIGFVNILFPALNITSGSTREMLSVPFLQTARYIQEYEDEISDEDAQAILKVLSRAGTLDKIAKSYNPVLADSVKNKYNKYATTSDLVNYFKVWFKGLVKHPDVYVQAYLNLHFGWFSFEGNDFVAYSAAGKRKIPEFVNGFDNYRGKSSYRKLVNSYLDLLNSNPATKAFIEVATYTWFYVFLLIYAIKHKKFKELLANSVVYLNYLICFVGPVAYMRYAIPMVCIAPFSLFITLKSDNKENIYLEENKNG